MSSTNKTENLGLNQFIASDKPSWLSDYNTDMKKIDEKTLARAEYATNGQAGVVDVAEKALFADAAASVDGGTYTEKKGGIKLLRQDGNGPMPSSLPYGELAVAKDGTVYAGDEMNKPVSSAWPGKIEITAAANAPFGYLLCHGQAVSRTEYAALFEAINIVYGEGDGSTTFNIPDLRQRFLLGSDGINLGVKGGKSEHTLTVQELPAHNHPLRVGTYNGTEPHNHSNGAWDAGRTAIQEASSSRTFTSFTDIFAVPAGSGLPHNNMPPYLSLNYIIKT